MNRKIAISALLVVMAGTLSACVAYETPGYYDSRPGYTYSDRPVNRDRDRDGIPDRRDRDRDGDRVPNRYDRRPDNPRVY